MNKAGLLYTFYSFFFFSEQTRTGSRHSYIILNLKWKELFFITEHNNSYVFFIDAFTKAEKILLLVC
jgi:hypothetical protein